MTTDPGYEWSFSTHRLPDLAKEIIAKGDHVVHLMIIRVASGTPVSPCGDKALGEWWSGSVVETTCPDCLRWIDKQL